MEPLARNLRNRLETTVKQARRLAEAGASAVLGELGVGEANPPAHLQDAQRALRRRLRAHGRQLGDALNGGKVQTIGHLVQEVAYQHWHRMLFARFLAENRLLMYDGVAVTLEECEELAPEMSARNGWELAGRLAERMLPQIFKSGSPVFELALPADVQIPLEALLAELPHDVFTASDSLGWVYQFWQADYKDAINKSEVKIGADQLPAVTQLFTEPYMVAFLLHNSLGAWWTTRHPDTPCPVSLDYLRTLEDGTPAAGQFAGWPDSLAEFRLLDPCCGSGHFLVAAFLLLVPMRRAAEGLEAREAVDRVLTENLHGLELDARCVEIAVFALALEAWRYPDERGQRLGVRDIPNPHIACCGLKVAAKAEDWQALVPDDATEASRLREGLARLHQQFAQAPLLGSLLAPGREKGDLYSADYAQLEPLLLAALEHENSGGDAGGRRESALSALGLLETARLLGTRYQLVVTNVPFQTAISLDVMLKDFISDHMACGKANLATAMALRLMDMADPQGAVGFVSPQTWMALKGYKDFRRRLLADGSIRLVARLGDGAFQSPGSNGEQISLTLLSVEKNPISDFFVLDASMVSTVEEKSIALRSAQPQKLAAKHQLANPQSIIFLGSRTTELNLGEFGTALCGVSTSDSPRFIRRTWEVSSRLREGEWEYHQSTTSTTSHFSGMDCAIFWQKEAGELAQLAASVRHLNHNAQNWRRGKPNWGLGGVVVSQMGSLQASIYSGGIYDNNCTAIVTREQSLVADTWAYVEDGALGEAVRKLNQKRSIEVGTFLAAEFDDSYWRGIANERYPKGLPKPYSDDPTQWIFHGHPCASVVWDEAAKWTAPGPLRIDAKVLQIAVARLLGYRWPAETDADMELADEARAFVAQSQSLLAHADRDGIVCIPPVGGEKAAADRLLNLLAAAYGADWNNGVLAQLLASAGHTGKMLESWLRDKFFAQHCELFHQRPFIWQVWDGLRDGFSALVNYHRLDTKTLEALIYTYLGNWIRGERWGGR